MLFEEKKILLTYKHFHFGKNETQGTYHKTGGKLVGFYGFNSACVNLFFEAFVFVLYLMLVCSIMT